MKKFTLYYSGSVSRKQMDQIRRTCPGAKLTPERIKQIKATARRYKAGTATVEELAEEYEVSTGAIYTWLHHEGVEVARAYTRKEKLGMARMYARGHSVQKVAAKFGCSTATVAKSARLYNVPVRSPGRVAKLVYGNVGVGKTYSIDKNTQVTSIITSVVKALKEQGII